MFYLNVSYTVIVELSPAYTNVYNHIMTIISLKGNKKPI